MLLDRYAPYFFNSNFREAGSDAGWEGYRGELVVIEGEVADDQAHVGAHERFTAQRDLGNVVHRHPRPGQDLVSRVGGRVDARRRQSLHDGAERSCQVGHDHSPDDQATIRAEAE